jgi:hypothetical protein
VKTLGFIDCLQNNTQIQLFSLIMGDTSQKSNFPPRKMEGIDVD